MRGLFFLSRARWFVRLFNIKWSYRRRAIKCFVCCVDDFSNHSLNSNDILEKSSTQQTNIPSPCTDDDNSILCYMVRFVVAVRKFFSTNKTRKSCAFKGEKKEIPTPVVYDSDELLLKYSFYFVSLITVCCIIYGVFFI